MSYLSHKKTTAFYFVLENLEKNNALALEFLCLSSAITLQVCALEASKSQCACIICLNSLAKVHSYN